MDLFDQIVADLDLEVDEPDVVNVRTLTSEELFALKGQLEEELLGAKQALRPTSQESRDRHSLRNAVQVEISRRTKR